jgi:hypothetical protein
LPAVCKGFHNFNEFSNASISSPIRYLNLPALVTPTLSPKLRSKPRTRWRWPRSIISLKRSTATEKLNYRDRPNTRSSAIVDFGNHVTAPTAPTAARIYDYNGDVVAPGVH